MTDGLRIWRERTTTASAAARSRFSRDDSGYLPCRAAPHHHTHAHGSHVTTTTPEHDDCNRCPVDTGRREFFRTSTVAVAAALAGLGMAARVAEALPVMRVSGSRLRATVKYPIPAADSVQIDKANEVILVRWEKQVYAFSLSCPHQNTALRWSEPDKRFICPKHKSNYTPTGGFIEGRATRGMDRLGITKAGAEVAVDVEQVYKEDENAAEWKAAVVAV